VELKYATGTFKWHFDNGESNAFFGTPEELDLMNEYVQILADNIQANEGLTITIEGHTSTQASPSFNLELSQKRANFVRTKILELLPGGEEKIWTQNRCRRLWINETNNFRR
jgi:flagellar motor protein MotB